MPAQSKVSKTLLPHHSAPRLGSVCPHSGSTKRAAATGQGRAVAATRGAIPERGNAEPKRGADRRGRAFWLLCRFCKVTRCKSETNSSRYRRNGYVHGKRQPKGSLMFNKILIANRGEIACRIQRTAQAL